MSTTYSHKTKGGLPRCHALKSKGGQCSRKAKGDKLSNGHLACGQHTKMFNNKSDVFWAAVLLRAVEETDAENAQDTTTAEKQTTTTTNNTAADADAEEDRTGKCVARTAKGTLCGNRAKDGSDKCGIHNKSKKAAAGTRQCEIIKESDSQQCKNRAYGPRSADGKWACSRSHGGPKKADVESKGKGTVSAGPYTGLDVESLFLKTNELLIDRVRDLMDPERDDETQGEEFATMCRDHTVEWMSDFLKTTKSGVSGKAQAALWARSFEGPFKMLEDDTEINTMFWFIEQLYGKPQAMWFVNQLSTLGDPNLVTDDDDFQKCKEMWEIVKAEFAIPDKTEQAPQPTGNDGNTAAVVEEEPSNDHLANLLKAKKAAEAEEEKPAVEEKQEESASLAPPETPEPEGAAGSALGDLDTEDAGSLF